MSILGMLNTDCLFFQTEQFSYLHIRRGLLVLLVQSGLGNAKALYSGMSNEVQTLTLFSYLCY